MQKLKTIEDPRVFRLNHGKSEIILTEDGFICMKNASASIKLHPNGQITIDGSKDITLEAKRHIHLNCTNQAGQT